MQAHLVWFLSFLRNCECLTSQQSPSKETRVSGLYGRRGSFIGVWAHSPALGDGQDGSEPHRLAAGGRQACRDFLIIWHFLQRTGKRVGLKSGSAGRAELPPPFPPSPTKLRAAHTARLNSFHPLCFYLQGSQRQNSPVAPGHRSAQHTLKTLERKVSPSANRKFQS